MLAKMQREIKEKGKYSFSKIGIYLNQSLYIEYKVNHEILVISYNQIEEKIYVYYRSKLDIANFYYQLRDLNFIKSKYSLILDMKGKQYEDILIVLSEILFRVDCMMIFSDIGIQKYSADSFAITGNYLDDQNNSIFAPWCKKGLSAQFIGSNNSIKVNTKNLLLNLSICIIGDNSRLILGENVSMQGAIKMHENTQVVIGNNVLSHGDVQIYADKDTHIVINNNCIFEEDVVLRTSNRCNIIDMNSNEVVQRPRNILIGEHVWISHGAKVLSGANIGMNTKVNSFSVVDKQYAENVVLSGSPAKVIMQDIKWEQ